VQQLEVSMLTDGSAMVSEMFCLIASNALPMRVTPQPGAVVPAP
jgi:hypothetical protein